MCITWHALLCCYEAGHTSSQICVDLLPVFVVNFSDYCQELSLNKIANSVLLRWLGQLKFVD
jgi:hypothetical protein